jgi:hypothetical protein
MDERGDKAKWDDERSTHTQLLYVTAFSVRTAAGRRSMLP